MHSPEHAKEVQEARRLGGLRRKREATLSGAYNFEGLSSIDGIQRLLEIVTLDTLSLENGVARNRTLAYLTMVALRVLEVGDLEQRVSMLEDAVQGKPEHQPMLFDIGPPLLESGEKENHEPG
jgi:hypothetical protein